MVSNFMSAIWTCLSYGDTVGGKNNNINFMKQKPNKMLLPVKSLIGDELKDKFCGLLLL